VVNNTCPIYSYTFVRRVVYVIFSGISILYIFVVRIRINYSRMDFLEYPDIYAEVKGAMVIAFKTIIKQYRIIELY